MFHVVSLLLVSSSSVDLLSCNILKKSLLSLKIFLIGSHFFFFIFIAHFRFPPTFSVNPLFIGCHNYLPNNSLISSLISTKLLSVFVLCILYKSNNFQAKANTLTYLRVNFTQQIESSHNSYPFQFFCMTL